MDSNHFEAENIHAAHKNSVSGISFTNFIIAYSVQIPIHDNHGSSPLYFWQFDPFFDIEARTDTTIHGFRKSHFKSIITHLTAIMSFGITSMAAL